MRSTGKQKDWIRFCFWNCGGFPVHHNEGKNHMIRQSFYNSQADVFGIAEVNVCWKLTRPQDRLRERLWGWYENIHISTAYAEAFPSLGPQQVGGTAVFTFDSACHRVVHSQKDSLNLGRWSSTKLQGKNGVAVRFVSVYRPVRNIHGPLSTWSQQRYLLDLQKESMDPIDKLDLDLSKQVSEWLETGEQIVLGIDMNEDVRNAKLVSSFYDLGLVDILWSKFGKDLPATYARGSAPIDGLFVTPGLISSFAGYLPVHGDHHILWVDIPMDLAFGYIPHSYTLRTPQRFKLQDPRVVEKFNKTLQSFVIDKNFIQRAIQLSQDMSIPASENHINEYNTIDKIRMEGIRLANKKCRKLRMGAVPFSPQLIIAAKIVQAWTLVVKRKQGKRVDSKYLRRMIKASGIQVPIATSVQEAKESLADAWARYNSLKKIAPRLRATWLEGLAEAKSNNGALSVAQELQLLKKREEQRFNARVIKSIKGEQRSGLSLVEIPGPTGWVELTQKSDIEEALATELKARFNQASGTPFLQEPLLSDVGAVGEGEGAQQILEGTYNTEDVHDHWTKMLIPFLQRHTSEILDTTFDPDEYYAGWKKVKEKTSAGPSGLTIPHMKGQSIDPVLNHFNALMAALPYNYGFSPERWKHGTDVMLQKKPGIYQIGTLRAILLFEADFNQNNKKLGRDMLALAEKVSAVAPEQFGSRKQKSAVDQSLNKVLTFDWWRQMRRTGALCSNDAKSCYDRIVHSMASLCMQRVGVPLQPIQSMLSTIQFLSHQIRTSFGDSTDSYLARDGITPVHGVGQGNGAGPQIWALVSTPVLNMLRSLDHGAKFHAPISGEDMNLVGFSFVDDTDLVTSDPDYDSPITVQKMQESIDAWEGGIRATGGAIVPSKSHWYLVAFKWKDGEPRYKLCSEEQGQITVQDAEGHRQPLSRLEPQNAERTLGVRIAPDGKMHSQFKYMIETARSWTDKLRSGHLPRHLSWQAWHSTIQKTLEYPLAATTLSREQCHKIDSILLNQILPRCGIQRSFPRAVVHGPQKYFGLAIPNLYIEQGIAHLQKLMHFSTAMNHSTGKLIRFSCETLKFYSKTTTSMESWQPSLGSSTRGDLRTSIQFKYLMISQSSSPVGKMIGS